MKAKPKLLGCPTPDVEELALATVRDDFDYRFCRNTSETLRQLAWRPDILVCNTHFDDGRVFEMLQLTRAHPYGKHLPILLIQSEPRLTPNMVASVLAAAEVLGVGVICTRKWLEEPNVIRERVLAAILSILDQTRHSQPEPSVVALPGKAYRTDSDMSL